MLALALREVSTGMVLPERNNSATAWLMDKLLSPNTWVLFASLLGIGGLVCVLAGTIIGSHRLTYTGMALLAPLIVGGVFLVVLVIPLLALANRKGKRK